MDFNAIDWNAMWQSESASSHFGKSSPKDLWNKRAAGFNDRIKRVMEDEGSLDKDDYISKMLHRMEVRPEWTVLDIGCGPGTLAIPLARKAKSITALDISSEMLKHLKTNADTNGLANIRCLNSSWQDAFEGGLVGEHDVVVASRSLMSGDVKGAISSIISIARQAVYLTFPIVHLPFDWEVYRAIGRNGKKHPPYIYIYNMLYQMGIQANVDILNSRVKAQFPNIQAAVEELQWRTDPFTPDEQTRLEEFLERRFAQSRDFPVLTHEGYSRWALIWWKKEDHPI